MPMKRMFTCKLYLFSLCITLFVFGVISSQAQQLFYSDAFIGGVTAAGYSPDYNTGGVGTLNVVIPAGSTIHKAYLLAGRHGNAAPITVNLNAIAVTFDATNQISPTFNSQYGGNSGVHAVDITAQVSAAVTNYTLNVPNQFGPANRFNDFYLYIAYDNPALAFTNTWIMVSTQDLASSNSWNMTMPYAMNTTNPVAMSLFTGYACNNGGDAESVAVNGTGIGIYGGNDINSGACGGPVGSFDYQNGVLTGLSDDFANQAILDADALADISGLVVNGSTTATVDFVHQSAMTDNVIWAIIFANGGGCSPANAGPDTTLCLLDSVQLQGSGGTIYQWSPAIGLSCTNCPNPKASPLSTTTYTMIASVPNLNCIDTDYVTITVAPVPTVSLGNDTSLCPGTSITKNAFNGTAGWTYLWDDGSNNPIRTFNAPGSYWVQVSNGNCIASDTLLIAMDTSLQAGFQPILDLGCEEDSVYFVNTSLNATQYFWDFGDGTNSTQASPLHVYANQGIYTVKLIAINPPCKDSITQVITIQHPLIAGFGITPDSLCAGDFTVLTPIVASTFSPVNYVVNWGDGQSNAFTTAIPQSHTYSTAGSYTVTMVVTDTIGCQDSMSRQVYIFPNTTANFRILDDTLCMGEPLLIQDSIDASLTFSWDFGDGNSLLNVHDPMHIYFQPGQYTVTLQVSSPKCPPFTTSLPVQIYSYPLVQLGADTSICPGLTGAIDIRDEFAGSGDAYLWNDGSSASNLLVTQPGYYWVEKYNVAGCRVSDSIHVWRDCYINIPNSFSPNGDGLNDYFIPRDLLSSGLTTFRMNIFNRWGELVFTTQALDGRGWDGKYDGVPQPVGVFVYVIDVTFRNGMHKKFQGNVTLMR